MKNETEKQEDCCGTCRWWLVDEPDNATGRCRRYPPTLGAEGRVRFPTVIHVSWCGEYSATRPKPVDAERPLGVRYEIRVLNDAVDGKAAALRVRLQAELDRRTNAPVEDLSLSGGHTVIENLPLSADGVRIAPGMMVHHPTEGTFAATSWRRDEQRHRWLIQYDPAHLESNPLRVSDCYKSGVAMVEAANGSS